MAKLSKSNHTTLSELNITPLLDLAFVLLVIFVLTTAPPSTEKPMELPKAESRVKKPENKIHYVTVDKSGNIYLNRKQVEPFSLLTNLIALRQVDNDLHVTIRGDAEAPYRRIREALKSVQDANVPTVKLATQSLPSR